MSVFFFLHLPERRDILLSIFVFREKVSGTNNNWFPSFSALAHNLKSNPTQYLFNDIPQREWAEYKHIREDRLILKQKENFLAWDVGQ